MTSGGPTPQVHNPDRLRLLASLDLLDTAPEAVFEDLAEAAAALCEAPVALVSLIDANRQWFKAKVGLDVCETPVEQAVCAYALDRTELLIIPDLAQDSRTRNNPLVTGEPKIRFYAGAPLRTESGMVLGTLCVVDTVARPDGLTPSQQRGLEALGRQVMNVIALRNRVTDRDDRITATDRERQRLAERAHSMDAAHAAGEIGTFEVDIATNNIRISDEFRLIYGLKPDEPVTTPYLESLIIAEDADLVSHKDSRTSGTASLNVVYRIRRASDGVIRSVSRKASFEYGDDGRPVRMFGAVQDVTEQTVINHEIAHRLKNMLAMVMALASQTLKTVPDREPVRAFEKRLVALGAAHEALLKQYWVAAPIREVVAGVTGQLGQSARIAIEGPSLTIGPKATLGLSLLLHELTTNAMKYGSLSADGGQVGLSWRIEDRGEPVLIVNWRESGGPPVSAPARKSFGSRLISAGLLGTGGADLSYDRLGLQAQFAAPLSKAQSQ